MAAVNLADAYINIIPSLKGVAPGISGLTGKFKAGGKKSGSLFSGAFSAGLGGAIGGIAAQAIGGAVHSVSSGISSMVSSFSELEDATGAASVVFGEKFMGPIIKQSEDAARTMGMTRSQVIDAANTFGTFGKAAGLSGKELVGFSTQMTKLAGDLSSFKGGSPEEAIQAIGAAMRGESEPIRRYGVLLDDATLKQRALKMGLISTTKQALTPQQRTLAAQAEILAQTKDATGDFLRTQNSTANVAKRFDATLKNLSTTVGQIIAPAFTIFKGLAADAFGAISSKLEAALPKIEAFWGKIQAGIQLFKTGDFTGEIGRALSAEEDSPIVDKILSVREAFIKVIKTIKQFKDAVSAAIKLLVTGDFTGAIGRALHAEEDSPIVDKILKIHGALKLLKTGNFDDTVSAALSVEKDAPIVGKILAVRGAFTGTIKKIVEFKDAVSAAIQLLVTGDFTGAIGRALHAEEDSPIVDKILSIRDAIAGVLDTLKGYGKQIWDAFASVGPQLMGIIPDVTKIASSFSPLRMIFSAIQPLLPQIMDGIGQVVGLLTQALPAVVPVAQQIGGMLSQLAGDLLSQLLPIVMDILNQVIPMLPQIAGVIGGIAQALLPMIGSLAGPLFTVIRALIPIVMQIVQTIVQAVIPLVPVLCRIAGSLVEVIGNIIAALFPLIPPIMALVQTIVSAVMPLLPPLMGLISTVVEAVVGLLAAISPLLPAITSLISAGISVLIAVLTPVIQIISFLAQIIVSVLTVALQIIMPIVTGVIGVFSMLATTLVGTVSGAVIFIANTFTTVFNAVFSVVRSIWNAIYATISGVVSAVGGFISAGFGRVRSTITGIWTTVQSITVSAWNYLTGSISSGVNRAVGFVKSLPGKVLSALGNLGSYLYDSGSSLLGGFIDGIKSGISGAVDTVKGALKTIRSYFPFSPAKRGPFSGRGWVAYSGKTVFPAFAAGMQSQLDAGVQVADDFMARTQKAMSRQMTASLGVSTQASVTEAGQGLAASRGGQSTGLDLVGLAISGRLEIGGDGLARIIDGRIVDANRQQAARLGAMRI